MEVKSKEEEEDVNDKRIDGNRGLAQRVGWFGNSSKHSF
jgi:hypothetical protein